MCANRKSRWWIAVVDLDIKKKKKKKKDNTGGVAREI